MTIQHGVFSSHKSRKDFSQEVRLLPSHSWHSGLDNSRVCGGDACELLCTHAPPLASTNRRNICGHRWIFPNAWFHLWLRNAILDEVACSVYSKKVSLWRLVTSFWSGDQHSWDVLPWDEAHRRRSISIRDKNEFWLNMLRSRGLPRENDRQGDVK